MTATPYVFRGNISDFQNKIQHYHFKEFEHPSLICFALFTEDLLIDWIVFYAVSPILLHNLTTLSRFTESLVYHLIWKKKIRNEKDCVILPTLRYPKYQLCRFIAIRSIENIVDIAVLKGIEFKGISLKHPTFLVLSNRYTNGTTHIEARMRPVTCSWFINCLKTVQVKIVYNFSINNGCVSIVLK